MKSSLLDGWLEDSIIRASIEWGSKFTKLFGEGFVSAHFSGDVRPVVWSAVHSLIQAGSSVTFETVEYEVLATSSHDFTARVKRYLSRLKESPAPEWSWVVNKCSEWSMGLAIKNSIGEIQGLLGVGELPTAIAAWRKTSEGLAAGCYGQGYQGVNGWDVGDAMRRSVLSYIDYTGEDVACPTGITALDSILEGGVSRGELFVFMSPLNTGKSWGVLCFTLAGLIARRGVLFCTLEMSKDQTLGRLVQMVGGLARPALGRGVTRRVKLWDASFTGTAEEEVDTLAAPGVVDRAIRTLTSYSRRLRVIEREADVFSLGDLEREIELWSSLDDRLPDVVVIDALNDLRLKTTSKFMTDRIEPMTSTCRALRSLAHRTGIGIVVTCHTNRSGLGAKRVEAEHVGESLGIMKVSDTAITLTQSREEAEEQRARLFVARARNKPKWKEVEIFQSLATGQFCLMSHVL